MRKYINIFLGLVLIAFAFWLVNTMILSNQRKQRPAKKIVKTVFIEAVENKNIPITIKANGNLEAKNKIQIFSEVQGILQNSTKEFKPGNSYTKGEVILRINNEEHLANLQAQKSNLYNSITSIMPDIRLDYPEEYAKWENYLRNFDFDKTTPVLPETDSEKEKFFISGRNIYTTYYNVKNMEVRLSKYTIRAPFNGILTETTVNRGSLIRQGQLLGEFIDPRVYEMEVAINAKYMDLLEKGNEVMVFNRDNNQNWKARIVRVNGKVDQASQTVKAYIEIKGEGLREGMYLEAHLEAKAEENAFRIARKLLVNNQSVFVLKDSVLDLVEVNPVYFDEKTVVVKGLENGTNILSRTVPGAHVGMKVKVHDSEKAQN